MKKYVILFISTLIFFTCQDSDKTKAELIQPEKKLSLEGTWELIGFYNYQDNKVVDSFTKQDDFKQVKIYTPTKVMWSKKVPNDSTDWFGYGNYNLNDTTLTEMLDYGSKVMNQVIKEKVEFKYELLLDKDKFTQIELDENGDRVYSENYVRIE
jgi:hypothetical protein